MLTVNTSLLQYRDTVKPGWIDMNGHMNVAYYVLVFDLATDSFLTEIGGSADYLRTENNSFFILEMNVSYRQELHAGDPLLFETQVIATSNKKIHLYHRMYHETDGYLAATNEILLLHIDMDTRRSAPMPELIRQRLTIFEHAHSACLIPDNLSRQFGV